MRAGRLRHYVALKGKTITANDVWGDPTTSATTLANVWAAIEPLQGNEAVVAQQVQPEATHVVRLRYTSVLSAVHTIQFGTRTLEISEILNRDERNVELKLLCKEAT